jgi:hypothetical protein
MHATQASSILESRVSTEKALQRLARIVLVEELVASLGE